MLSECRGNQINVTQRIYVPHSLGSLYTMVGEFIGYGRYGASGGDVGARVTAWLGAQEPAALVGLHLSAGAISPGSRTSSPCPPSILANWSYFTSPSLLPMSPRSAPYF